jgi:hypothetical protein
MPPVSEDHSVLNRMVRFPNSLIFRLIIWKGEFEMEDNVREFFDLVARMMARRWLQDSNSFKEKKALPSKAESMEADGPKEAD